MTDVTVNGTTLYYTETGQGPTTLVMHGGLGVDHTTYRGLDMFADRLRLVYYDHRHNGRSGRPPLDTLTMEQLADDAAALATHVAHEPVIVIGHSYGGFIAQEFALRHPGLVRALILVDTTAGQLGSGEDPNAYQGPPPPDEWVAIVSDPPADDAEMAKVFPDLLPFYLRPGADPAAAREAMADTIYSAEAAGRSMQVLAQWSSFDRLARITVPTLVLVGAHDVITSPPQALRIADHVPNSTLVEFASSGHFPWIEEPERFNEVVRSFLSTAARG
ncbi:alpha/beta hydrolase [Actinocrispum sp. NPDC049592]|uniref:alpha/beta fold hydrolase n=1 Tax=Actinocrispum sp. NPDC049592 TaxID=3154835 RepID=UPI00342EEF86